MSIVAIEESVLISILARLDELENVVYAENGSASYIEGIEKKEGCEILNWIREKKPVFTVNQLNTGNRRVKSAKHARKLIAAWLESGDVNEIVDGLYEATK